VNQNLEPRNPEPGTGNPEPGLSYRILPFVGVALAVLVVYFRALSAFFFEDDFQLLVGSWNFDPANLLHLRARFKPVFEIYFWLGSAVFGRSTVGFHAASLIVHVFNGWLLLAIARRLGMRPVFAFLTALLFVVQPAFVSTVAWVGAVAESLVVLFGCTSAYAVLKFRESSRRAWLAAALASFTLALFAHESGVVFLPIILLVDHVAAGRGWPGRDLLRISWPFVLLTGAYLVMTFTANTPEYLGQEIGYRAGPHVIRKVFDYIAAIYVGERKLLSHVLVALVLATVLWKGSARARLGMAWMILGILPFAPFEIGIMGRYTYVPAIGFTILLGEGLAFLHGRLSRRSTALANGVVLVLALAIGARSVHFARDGVKDHFMMAERYRLFLADLRQERSGIADGTLVVLARDRITGLNPHFVEAAVQWEYKNSTLRVEIQ
jgi:hypothetical protein